MYEGTRTEGVLLCRLCKACAISVCNILTLWHVSFAWHFWVLCWTCCCCCCWKTMISGPTIGAYFARLFPCRCSCHWYSWGDVHRWPMPIEHESHFPCPRQGPSLENWRTEFRPIATKFPPRPIKKKKDYS